jgi:hypothetical protein
MRGLWSERGATGLEPATSGVTGRARGVTILHGATRKSLNSRGFGSVSSARFNDVARACPTVPPHPGPIAASSIDTARRTERRPQPSKAERSKSSKRGESKPGTRHYEGSPSGGSAGNRVALRACSGCKSALLPHSAAPGEGRAWTRCCTLGVPLVYPEASSFRLARALRTPGRSDSPPIPSLPLRFRGPY